MSEINQDSGRGGCPPDADLACFVDGDLTTDARARIVAHLAACDDCREIVAMASAEACQRERRPGPSRWYRQRRILLGLAAALAASVAVVLVPRAIAPVSTAAWTDIATAMGAERTVAARLSAQNEYHPLSSPSRSAADPAARSNFRLEAVASRLRDEAATHPTVDRLHAAGVAALVLGRTDDALQTLLLAASREHASAGVFADLAAAHVARATQHASPGAATTEWLHAVEAAEHATSLEAGLAAGWFNRALALEGLGRQAQARQAWLDYTTRFTADDGWRAEALARVNPGVR